MFWMNANPAYGSRLQRKKLGGREKKHGREKENGVRSQSNRNQIAIKSTRLGATAVV
jgi:hypothetical protein